MSDIKVACCVVAWTKTNKFWVGGSLVVANDESIPRECFPKISEILKRNGPSIAPIT